MPAVSAPPRVTYTDSHTRACRRVGSQEVAAQLAGYEGDKYGVPEGWTYLAHGATRTALRGPDGWIYKVAYRGYSGVNAVEVKYWARGKAHPEYRQHIPHHRLFTVGDQQILAVEPLVVDRSRSTSDEDGQVFSIRKMAAHIGCNDIHASNIGWRGNVAVLLDAGSGTYGYMTKYDGCATCNPDFED